MNEGTSRSSKRATPCVRRGVLAVAATWACAASALADAAPDHWRSTEYYVAHGALTAGLIAGGALTDAAREELAAGGWDHTATFPLGA